MNIVVDIHMYYVLWLYLRPHDYCRRVQDTSVQRQGITPWRVHTERNTHLYVYK